MSHSGNRERELVANEKADLMRSMVGGAVCGGGGGGGGGEGRRGGGGGGGGLWIVGVSYLIPPSTCRLGEDSGENRDERREEKSGEEKMSLLSAR